MAKDTSKAISSPGAQVANSNPGISTASTLAYTSTFPTVVVNLNLPTRASPLCFRHLPDAVRCRIWKLAVGKRLVEVRLPERATCNKHDFVSDIPTIMLVCRESRMVGMQIYAQLANPNSLNRAYFHPQLDTLFIRGGMYIKGHLGILDHALPYKEFIQKLAVFGEPNDFMNISGFNRLRKIIIIERKGAFLNHGNTFCNGACSRGVTKAAILPNNETAVPEVFNTTGAGLLFWENENKRRGPTQELISGNPFFGSGHGLNVEFVWKRACLAAVGEENWFCHTRCDCGFMAALLGEEREGCAGEYDGDEDDEILGEA